MIILVSAICTVPCENEGQCVGPDTCNCTDNWEGGTCAIVKFENLISFAIYVYYKFFCEVAICAPAFCLNGGNCSFPNRNCSCTNEWSGERCENGKYILETFIMTSIYKYNLGFFETIVLKIES